MSSAADNCERFHLFHLYTSIMCTSVLVIINVPGYIFAPFSYYVCGMMLKIGIGQLETGSQKINR